MFPPQKVSSPARAATKCFFRRMFPLLYALLQNVSSKKCLLSCTGCYKTFPPQNVSSPEPAATKRFIHKMSPLLYGLLQNVSSTKCLLSWRAATKCFLHKMSPLLHGLLQNVSSPARAARKCNLLQNVYFNVFNFCFIC